MEVKFIEWGTSLGTRQIGRIVKQELDKKISQNNQKIILDFSGVKLVTNSFADEAFGKIILEIGFDEFKKRTTFRNVDQFVGICIKKALVNRVNETRRCCNA